MFKRGIVMSVDKKRPVYVLGHKNPDTDSICSAIAYANLKNLLNRNEDENINISVIDFRNREITSCGYYQNTQEKAIRLWKRKWQSLDFSYF